MNNMGKCMIKYLFCLVSIVVVTFFASGCGEKDSFQSDASDTSISSENVESDIIDPDQIIASIHSGDISTAITLYNEMDQDSDHVMEISDAFQEFISNTALSFYSEDMEYEEACNALKEVQNLNNNDINALATENLNAVINEYSGNISLIKAEEFYAAGDLPSTMKNVLEIKDSYSQYDYAQELYNTCKQEILDKTVDIVSDEEYTQTQQYLETVLEVVEDEDITAAKKRLEDGYVAFTKVSGVIENAEGLYEKGQYGASFASLEEGINNYPDDNRLLTYLNVYHEVYYAQVANDVGKACKEKEYKEAKQIVAHAIEEYDCQELQELSDLVNEQSKITNRLKKSTLEKFELVAQGWEHEKAKVEHDGIASYVLVSGKKLVLGDYSDDEITVLSIGGDIIASLTNIDILFDIRDLSYDITHWGEEEYFVIYLATDTVALLPVIGCVKHFMIADAVSSGIKHAPDLIKKLKKVVNVADTVSDSAKGMKKFSEAADKAKQIIKKAESASDTALDRIGHYTFISTRNSKFVGSVHPKTKVSFVRKRVKYQNGNLGKRIAGVFPKFDSQIDIQLPKELWKESFDKQKAYLLKELQEIVDSGDLKKLGKLTEEDIKDIQDGVLPAGYVWHHNEEEGLMQLVDAVTHEQTAHTGGMVLWGIGYE